MFDRRKRQIALQRDVKTLFGSEAGQRVLKHLAENNFAFQHTTVVGDPYLSAFNDGRRAVVLDLMRTLNVDEVALMKKLMEEEDDDGIDNG